MTALGDPPDSSPQLPYAETDSVSGSEPAIVDRRSATEVLCGLLPKAWHQSDLADFAGKTVAEWWAVTNRGDLMSLILPSGDWDSPQRRRLVRTLCRCARLSLTALPPTEERPNRALADIEKWAGGADGTPWDVAMNATHAMWLAYAAGELPEPVPSVTLAVHAAGSGFSRYAPIYEAMAFAAIRAEDCATVEGIGRVHLPTLTRCAEIVREEYPDVASVLAAKQAEISARSR